MKLCILLRNLPFKIHVNHFVARVDSPGGNFISIRMLWVRGLMPLWILRQLLSVINSLVVAIWNLLSCVQLFVTLWTIKSMEFSRPEYWSGQPFPSPGDLPNTGIEPRSHTLQADSLPAEPQGKPQGKKLYFQLKTSMGALFLLPSDVYVRSFLCLFYTLIKLYHTKALSHQALSLALDWIPLLCRPIIPASFMAQQQTFSIMEFQHISFTS